jgi:hypothetical protein
MSQDPASDTLLAQGIEEVTTNALSAGQLWLPGAAERLVAYEWSSLKKHYGLSPETYCTDRIREHNRRAPRNVFGSIAPKCIAGAAQNPIIVEHPFLSESYYRKLDLTFYSNGEIVAHRVEQQLSLAIDCLALVPNVATAVMTLVRVIHILKSPDPAYDISHSDPQVPFSVFVSLPAECTARGQLRLAEALLHEAMHLQLTLLESHLPLARWSGPTYFSPWKRAARPVQGLMHGLYVFGVIDCFLEAVQAVAIHLDPAYVSDRRAQIADEVAQVLTAEFNDNLSEFGSVLYQAILTRFSRS